MRPIGGAGQPMGHLDLRFPVFQRDLPYELMFYVVLGPVAHLDLRFPVFMRGGRFEIIKYNAFEPWLISTDACAAKSPTRREDTFCFFAILGVPGLAGNH